MTCIVNGEEMKKAFHATDHQQTSYNGNGVARWVHEWAWMKVK